MANELEDRLFNFSIRVINGVRKLPNEKEYKVIAYQLIKSATSVGANYQEAQGAVSQADFTNKIGLCLKEIRETNYWIRIIIAICHNEKTDWETLKQESNELKNILASIYNKMKLKK
ncbi:conserved hypothetical protein [Capnocytophaga canis]|uniref:four helix bundle protein n=1 Tax=Capnocytophaga TaxID=1016 RepID=UPI0005899466|nr:four helix bundle protein [Capnocytophaga canis]CEN43450.1 conserved hypothetical protein [Capnocytophaga canis]